MQLVIKDGRVVATHKDHQEVAGLYPGCEVVLYARHVNPGDPDPRTDAEKAAVYRDQRCVVYPSVPDQLDMIYHDQVDGTTVWKDTIAAVKNQFPKP